MYNISPNLQYKTEKTKFVNKLANKKSVRSDP